MRAGRRTMIPRAVKFFLCVTAALLAITPVLDGDGFTIGAPVQKPNIIFILTDDLDAKSRA